MTRPALIALGLRHPPRKDRIMTELNPELIEKATKALVANEFVLCRTHNATADDDLGHLTCSVCHARARTHARTSLEAVADDIRAEALEDAADEIEAEYDRRGVVAVGAQYQYSSGVLDGLDIAERVVRDRVAEIAGDDS